MGGGWLGGGVVKAPVGITNGDFNLGHSLLIGFRTLTKRTKAYRGVFAWSLRLEKGGSNLATPPSVSVSSVHVA